MNDCIALIRGINVGRAKRVAMADLRGLFGDLGFSKVRTVLNSGNVVFQSPGSKVRKIATDIESEIELRYGFSASVIVITAKELSAIIAENPLLQQAADPSKHLVAFVRSSGTLAPLKGLLGESWAPDALAVGKGAAYLWCAQGVITSKLMQAVARATGEEATTRNWATVLKLDAATRVSDAL